MSRKIRLKRKATNFPGKHPRKRQCAPNQHKYSSLDNPETGARQTSVMQNFRDMFGF